MTYQFLNQWLIYEEYLRIRLLIGNVLLGLAYTCYNHKHTYVFVLVQSNLYTKLYFFFSLMMNLSIQNDCYVQN